MIELLRKTPQRDLEAERAVLGACFLDPVVVDMLIDELAVEDFYLARHQTIFEALVELRNARKPVDKLAVASLLRERGVLEAAGCVVEIDSLTVAVPTPANAPYYADLVLGKARLRRTQHALAVSQAELEDRVEDVDAALDAVEQRVFEATRRHERDTPKTIGQLLGDVFKRLERTRAGELVGIPFGFCELDELTLGLPRSELSVVAARPAVGKSAFATNVARNATFGLPHARADRRVAFFSLEMPAESVARNVLCSVANVDTRELRAGKVVRVDEERLVTVADDLSRGRLWILEPSRLTVAELRARCRRIAAKSGLDMVVVDYLQLMSGDGSARRQRHEEVAEISRGLKALAVELAIPVVALAQLNRQVEQRSDPRPRLADLRESGSIEADAALVCLLHREEKELQKTQVIVAKNRYGPTGTATLNFDRRFCRFEDLPTPEAA
jgi:replicative DNA helicase